MVKTLKFQDLDVPVPGYGCMGLSSTYGAADDTQSLKTLQKALDIGCTFWDTASLYGAGHNEKLLGDFLKKSGARDKLFIASKCGFTCLGENPSNPYAVSNKPDHIRSYIEGSIERLGTIPDLYYLHRIDPDTPLEESITTLNEMKQAGKTKFIGLSECGAKTLRKACAIAKIDAIQVEYSPWSTDPEENGLLDAAKELGVAVIAYSPLGRGMMSGQFRTPDDFPADDFRRMLPRFSAENMPQNLRIVDEFERIAKSKGGGITASQLALAWVIAQGAIPIPGTRGEDRLVDNFKAGQMELSSQELQELRGVIDRAKPAGGRYHDSLDLFKD